MSFYQTAVASTPGYIAVAQTPMNLATQPGILTVNRLQNLETYVGQEIAKNGGNIHNSLMNLDSYVG